MDEVLNPYLYGLLKRRFRRVKVANPGEAFIYQARRDPFTNTMRLDVSQGGEQYLVCCPMCGDRRFRLNISHMYGQSDHFGRKMTFMAVCFNETACMSLPGSREDLLDMIEDNYLNKAQVKKGIPIDEKEEIDWPGSMKRLEDLEPNHAARLYLQSRGFDYRFLSRCYDVRYCLDSYYFLATHRLIIPVMEKGVMRGWQARYVGELPWDRRKEMDLPPKYWSAPGMKKSRRIYNIDRARRYQTGVIVEGTTDVWAFGAPAGGIFGNHLSVEQAKQLFKIFGQRSLILLLDPETMDEAIKQHSVRVLKKHMGNRFAFVQLPEHYDPGRFGVEGRETLRALVTDRAVDGGLQPCFETVKP